MLNNILHFNVTNIEQISAYARRINDEQEFIGYYNLPLVEDFGYLDELQKYKNIKNVILIGVGGSSLGTKAICQMLNKEIIFLDNLDENSFDLKLDGISLEDSVFIISSKSGTTIETISLFKAILARFTPKNFDNFIFITDKDSALEKYAQSVKSKIFYIPKNVGGRFSVLSNCGLVPLALKGVDISEILKGAKSIKENFLNLNNEIILQKAYHFATHPNIKMNVLFSYDDRFSAFNEWYVQLWAESLGKKRGYKRIGLTPIGLIGPKDQHSFLQLIMDGPKDKSVSFLRVLPNDKVIIPNISLPNLQSCDFTNNLSISYIQNSQAKATMQALKSENISTDEIILDKLDEWHIGSLIYYFELLTSAVGVMLGINTYNQPGVELAKVLLKKILP